jgi:hypothetical protein
MKEKIKFLTSNRTLDNASKKEHNKLKMYELMMTEARSWDFDLKGSKEEKT